MISFIFSLVGIAMVIIPQMHTLRFKYLLQQCSAFAPNGSVPQAQEVYKATVQANCIIERWDNYAIQKIKKHAIILGVILIIIGLALSFDSQPLYFFSTIYAVLFGLSWLFLECRTVAYCLKHYQPGKRKFKMLVILAPIFIIAAELIFAFVLTKGMEEWSINCNSIFNRIMLKMSVL